MSAPHIPNLNTLRKGPTTTSPRFRNRRGEEEGAAAGDQRKTKDEIIQNTDNDAATSRLSAVEAGYLTDDFARLLSSTGKIQPRLPLMNRGSYVRTQGIDKVVDAFLRSVDGGSRKQIISLGAGSDTRYFRLKQKTPALNIVYHEIDFESNTKVKIDRLKEASEQISQLTGVDLNISDEGQVRCRDYYIHAKDLRSLSLKNNEENDSEGLLHGIEGNVPTLIISECCLIYLSPKEAENVLRYFNHHLGRKNSPLAIVIYEPIRPNDAFGRTMVRNLIARGIRLQTLERYADLENQRQRLSDHEFESARSADIDFIWRNWISDDEKERIEGLEWMDEVEEFVLLAKHYCISWGWKGFGDANQFEHLAAPSIE